MSVKGKMEVFFETTRDISERKSVLIIDDDVELLKILRVYLQDDYKVSIVNSAKTASELLDKMKPDVILLDYMMPEMSGADLLKILRDRADTRSIPVFFLTGNTEPDTIKECLSYNPSGYIVKPIAKAALLGKLKDFFCKG